MRLLRYNSLTAFADWMIDYPDVYYHNQGVDVEHVNFRQFAPDRVAPFDSVFVKTDLLHNALPALAKIAVPWHLLTGNSDLDIQQSTADTLLSFNNLVSWSGNNLQPFHSMCLQIPIGLSSTGTQRPNTFTALPKQNILRPIKMCLTPLSNTHPERHKVKNWIQKNCYTVEGDLLWQDYQNIVSVSQFSICPRGNGVDTHRVMEALALGAIPVVKTSYLDKMYSEIGCKIIDEWQDLYNVNKWLYSAPDQKYATFDFWLQKFHVHKTLFQQKMILQAN